jgi:hypothetical protein
VQNNDSTFSITRDLGKFCLSYVQIYTALLEGKSATVPSECLNTAEIPKRIALHKLCL